jgi:hypothetical protein
MKSRKLVPFLFCLILVALFVAPALADYTHNPPPPPAPVVYTSGAGDGKIDFTMGASGVAGEITDIQTEKGIQFKDTESVSVSGNAAYGANDFANSSRNSCFGDSCTRDGLVKVGRFELNAETVKTHGILYVDNSKTATVLQNTANMNASVIAAANACDLPVQTIATGTQTFAQSITGAVLPVTGGVINSGYNGTMTTTVKVGNY